MRTLLAALLALHGAIHVLGFVKAFRLADVAALTQPILPATGLLWLAAALLLVAAGTLSLLGARLWWLPALSGVVLSQALIVAAWDDAKYGTVANVIVLIPLVIVLLDFRPGSLRSTFRRDVRARLAAVPVPPVTDADLATLPPLVRAYLRRAGVVGRPRVRNFHATFTADMRGGPDAPWMHSHADQYEFVGPNARLFYMEAARAGVPVDVLHRYVGGHASMRVRVAGLVPVTNADGPEMTRSETVTLLNDLCVLAPATLVDAPIRWETLDDHTVRATFTNAGHTVRAELTFDATGDLANFRSDDRYRIDGAGARRLRWTTPLGDYRDYGGVRLARRGDARWTDGGLTWTYGRFTLDRIAYNVGALGE